MTRKGKTNRSVFGDQKIRVLPPLLALLVLIAVHGCAIRPDASAPIKYFYIDKTGKKVLDGIGYYGDSFHEGLAIVCDEYRDDGAVQPFRYIDHSGKTRFKISAYEAYPFSEGLALVRAKVVDVKGGCAGYIDKQGKWVLAPRFCGYGDSFSDGLALTSTPDWKKLQYIDHSGNQVIDASKTFASCNPSPWHQNLRPFSEGRALVIIGDVRDSRSLTPWRYGYIDKNGNWKIALSELGGSPFCEGLAHRFWTRRPPGKTRSIFVDDSGKELLKVPYHASNLSGFSDGLCAVSVRTTSDQSSHRAGDTNFKYGYCDRNGHLVVEPKYDQAGEFSEGLAAVTIDGKVGYIDTKGKLVISPQFAYAGDFSEGLAVAIPFAEGGSSPELKLWGAPTGKYFARQRIEWIEPESRSD